jgi:hypothetical protein
MKKQIKVTCYGKDYFYNSKEEAINDFLDGISCCDPQSSECSRYISIISQLQSGALVATDEI